MHLLWIAAGALLLCPALGKDGPLVLDGRRAAVPPLVTPASTAAPASRDGFAEDSADVVNDLIGEGVYLSEYDGAGYTAVAGGPIERPSYLSCDLDSGPCCWSNLGHPGDQLDWLAATGVPEHYKFHANFGPFEGYEIAQPPPNPYGNYFVAATKDGATSDEAHLVSCTIACAEGDVQVSLRQHRTTSASLQVCKRRSALAGGPAALTACKELSGGGGDGRSVAVLPGGELFDIVLVASNLVGALGEAVIVDDIDVGYKPCELRTDAPLSRPTERPATVARRPKSVRTRRPVSVTEKPRVVKEEEEVVTERAEKSEEKPEPEPVAEPLQTQPPPPATEQPASTTGDACASLSCGFEPADGLCAYGRPEGGELAAMLTEGNFAPHTGRYGNRVTGVPFAADGDGYAVSYLHPGEISALHVRLGRPLSEPIVISYRYYRATAGVSLRGCCDAHGVHCPFQSDTGVAAAARRWKDAHFVCPEGSASVTFTCDNAGANQGACAIDSVHARSVPRSGRARDPSAPLC